MTFFYDDDDDKQVQPRTMKRSQTLRFVNGYAILTDDATSSRASMVEEDFLEEEEDVEGDISKARGEKEKETFVPAYVALDRIVLRFYAKFTERVQDSATETSRERKVVFRVYAEDLTIDATEPKQENSGLQQGLYLKRTKCEEVFKDSLKKKKMTTTTTKTTKTTCCDTKKDEEVKKRVLESLKVGNTITVCGRTFFIYACDGFTRQFYEEGEGMIMPPNETNELENTTTAPKDLETTTANNNDLLAFKRAKGPPNARLDDIARFTEAKLGRPSSALGPDTRKKFLEHDGEVLRFYATWKGDEDGDKEKEEATTKRFFCVHYFLADDSVEVIEKGGRALLRRGKLPKISDTKIEEETAAAAAAETTTTTTTTTTNTSHSKPLDFSVCSIGSSERIPYLVANEIVVGQTVNVYGRNMFIYGCDRSTETWYLKTHGENAVSNIDISEPKVPIQEKQVPRHEGLAIGSEEDTLQNCLALNPKPPKKDYRKAFEKGGCVLRFEARIIRDGDDVGGDYNTCMPSSSSPSIIVPSGGDGTTDASANDFQRNFVLSFFLEDDTASVFEPPAKNGGNGGKFLERGKIYDSATEKAYTIKDMFVGNVLKLHKRCFKLIAADAFTLKTLAEAH